MNASLRYLLIVVFALTLAVAPASTAQETTPEVPAPTETATEVPTATWTETATQVPTATLTEAPTATETQPPTETALPTLADTAIPSETATLEATATDIPTNTETATIEAATETLTPTITETETVTPTETATPTATAISLPPEPPLELIYNDNFDDGMTGMWVLGAGWDYAPNETGSELQASNTTNMAYFMAYPLDDFIVQARLKFSEGAILMHLRLHDNGSAYVVWIDQSGQVALLRNGEVIALGSASQALAGTWHTVRASVIGDVIRISIDGSEIIGMQDPSPLLVGAVAFAGIGTGTLHVEDFLLWQPAEFTLDQGASLESAPFMALQSTVTVSTVADLITELENANPDANANGVCDDVTLQTTITLAAGTYTLDSVHNTSTRGPNGLPRIICDVTIVTENGSETNRAVIERSDAGGTPLFRILEAGSGGTLTLDYLEIQNGNVQGVSGGGILNIGGELNVRNSVIRSNRSSQTGNGGGLHDSGSVGRSILIENSVFSDNWAGSSGGGLFLGANSVDDSHVIVNSQFINNIADVWGGGLTVAYLGSLPTTITDTIIQGNMAFYGAGADLLGNVKVERATISGNVATSLGGGISNGTIGNNNQLTITDTIIANNVSNDNSGGAIYVLESGTPNTVVVSNSCITNNSDTGVQRSGAAADVSVNASNNWWGAADGPSGVGTGSGDSVGQYIISSPFLTSPPTTNIPEPCGYNANFTNLDFKGKDIELQGVMFWVIFIETSSDSVISGSPADSDLIPNFANFLFEDPYCIEGANPPSNNAAPAPEPFLMGTPPQPTDPNPLGISTYVRHCKEDHRFMYAQTMMNGFLSYERSGEPPVNYATQNNSEALKRDNTLWTISPCKQNAAGQDYEDAIDRNNRSMWLYLYMECIGNNPNVDISDFNAGRARRAYILTIFPQIQAAIDDFYLETTADPTNGAIANLDANIGGNTIFSCVGTCFKLITNAEGQIVAGDQITTFTKADTPLGSVWFQGANVTQQDILEAYNRHIQNPSNKDIASYTPFASSVLQPVLRLNLDKATGNLLGYSWSTRSYQRNIPGSGNPIHIPRYTD